MPAYDALATSVNKPVVTTGRQVTVWDNEVVDPNASPIEEAASRQVSMHRDAFLPICLSAEIEFAAAPGNFTIDFQTADTDEDKYYVTKASVTQTGLNTDNVCRIEALNIVAKFARLKMKALTNSVAVTARIC